MTTTIIKSITILLVIVVQTIEVFAQMASPVVIHTPIGCPLNAYNIINTIDAAYFNGLFIQQYPDVTIVGNSTQSYNCHGYAWYMSEGGEPVWIGLLNTDPDPYVIEDQFWLDGSYIEVSDESLAQKVSYYEGNHSAIRINSNLYRSKMGIGPLVEHAPGYGPDYYNMSYRKYYLKIAVTGPDTICPSGSTFSINNLPSGCTVTWENSSNLLYVSGQNTNSYVVQSWSKGAGWVRATISSNCGSVVLPQKDVFVNVLPGIIGITGLSSNLVGGSSTYTAYLTDVSVNVTSYNWSLMPGVYNNYFAPNGHTCDIAWYTAGYYALAVNAQNTCGSGNTYYFPISIFSGGFLALSPNPAKDNVQVSIMRTQNSLSISDTTSIISDLFTTSDQELVKTYTIKIYNTFGKVFYSVEKMGDSFTIPVNNLPEGTYIIEANDGKESYKQQLIVNH